MIAWSNKNALQKGVLINKSALTKTVFLKSAIKYKTAFLKSALKNKTAFLKSALKYKTAFFTVLLVYMYSVFLALITLHSLYLVLIYYMFSINSTRRTYFEIQSYKKNIQKIIDLKGDCISFTRKAICVNTGVNISVECLRETTLFTSTDSYDRD